METKVFLAKIEDLHDMLDFLQSYCIACGAPTLFVQQVILASEEALVNIIHYGYKGDQAGPIEISCEETNPQGLRITIKDQGIAFNPLEYFPDHLSSLSKLMERTEHSLGGFGIFMFLGLMDSVDYQRVDEKNILTLTKLF